MVEIKFERLITRGLALRLSKELDMAGMKTSVNRILEITVISTFLLFLGPVMALKLLGYSAVIAAVGGIVGLVVPSVVLYMYLEYIIDQRKTKLENMLPDFLQIAAANLRSGISLERALLLAARPEFSFLADDIKEMNRRIFSGETLDAALQQFAKGYRSYQLQHAIRMMVEALRYGGAMADLLAQISKDLRNQQIMQKEIAGQLLMYSIFVAFAGLVAAPVLYGLTTQMIVVTDNVWSGILKSNPGGLPTTGIGFLKPSPPKISPGVYKDFSYLAILMITGFASLIMSAISTGSPIKGAKYLPVFVIGGLIIYTIVQAVIAGLFASIGTGV